MTLEQARRDGFGGGCEEREQTLDALLSEMDGFAYGSRSKAGTEAASEPVVVIAATNRAEVTSSFSRNLKISKS